MAQGEFQDVLTYYPQDDLAGNAQYYLGEIAYQQKDYANAVKSYNAVLEGFSGSTKAAAAHTTRDWRCWRKASAMQAFANCAR